MKAISSKVTRVLPVGATITCADNSGVKLLQIISVRGYKGTRRTKPTAGVACLVKCRVEKGTEKVRKQTFHCVIVRQKKEFKRSDGTSIQFSDNAAVIVDEKNMPKGTQIKGPIAREVVERFPSVGKIASTVV